MVDIVALRVSCVKGSMATRDRRHLLLRLALEEGPEVTMATPGTELEPLIEHCLHSLRWMTAPAETERQKCCPDT